MLRSIPPRSTMRDTLTKREQGYSYTPSSKPTKPRPHSTKVLASLLSIVELSIQEQIAVVKSLPFDNELHTLDALQAKARQLTQQLIERR